MADTPNNQPSVSRKVIREVLCALLWLYAIIKLFVFDFDVYLAQQYAPTKHLMQPVEEIAKTILPRLTAGRYSMLSLNETLEVEKLSYGKLDVDPIDLNTGAQGQLALLLRLAIIEYLGGKERQIVVIDDAVVNFDEDRLQEGKRVLSDLAQKHQVIYLTCHSELSEWGEATILEL